MNWHILGVGAIGGLWGGNLALSGQQVTLILRDPDAVRQYQNAPLRLERAGRFSEPPVAVTTPATIDAPIDYLLVATKSFATLQAIATIEHCFTPSTRILLLQNGMGFQSRVVKSYASLPVIAGISTDGAYRRERFHVVHAGKGNNVFGALSTVNAETIDSLKACFGALALDADWVDDIVTPMWHKVAVNACLNPLTAIHRCRNGGLLHDADIRRQLKAIAAETEEVMRAAGIEPPSPGLYARVVGVVTLTAENFSSMHEDVANGRRTEIEHINGFICEQGAMLGIDTPLNSGMLEQVRRLVA